MSNAAGVRVKDCAVVAVGLGIRPANTAMEVGLAGVAAVPERSGAVVARGRDSIRRSLSIPLIIWLGNTVMRGRRLNSLTASASLKAKRFATLRQNIGVKRVSSSSTIRRGAWTRL